jgi:hypothetical protein
MTTPQRITLMADWWPKACAAQGWNKNDKPKRLEVLSQAVGRKLVSANDLNNRADIDAVKAHLKMLADNVAATIETDHPDIGRRRRLQYTIGELAQTLGGLPYLLAIARDQFHLTPGLTTLEDLTNDQLQKLIYTLSARARAKKDRISISSPTNEAAKMNMAADLCPAAGPPWDYDAPTEDEPF